MKKMSFFHFLFMLISNVYCLDFKVVDLTHELSSSTIYWPGNPDYNFTILARGLSSPGGFWYESNYIGTAEHGGTHLDSPAHFSENKWRTHNIPMDKLIGPGVIVDVKEKVAQNPDYRVSVSDLEQWEKLYGRIPKNAIVIMNSGWHDRYPNASLVFNTASTKDPGTFHFPGWHEDAATWLTRERVINILGVDTPSVDYGQSTTFPVHVVLGGAEISGAENVGNLDLIPNSGSTIFVAVTKIKEGSGGPARIFATVPVKDTSSGNRLTLNTFVLLMTIFIILKG